MQVNTQELTYYFRRCLKPPLERKSIFNHPMPLGEAVCPSPHVAPTHQFFLTALRPEQSLRNMENPTPSSLLQLVQGSSITAIRVTSDKAAETLQVLGCINKSIIS